MSSRDFFTQLTIISLFTAVILFFLHRSEHFSPYQTLSYISLGGFILLTIGMYFMAHRAANGRDKNLFLQQVLGSTFLKMMITIMVIFAYQKFAEPPTKMYAIPFLIVYVIFTIFETYFMMKLSKVKPNHEEK